MSKIDKFKLETDGWYDDGADGGSYDPGYYALELWERISGVWKCVWESSHIDGDEIGGHATIKSELIEAMPNFGLTPDDIEDIDSDCIYDWEIR